MAAEHQLCQEARAVARRRLLRTPLSHYLPLFLHWHRRIGRVSSSVLAENPRIGTALGAYLLLRARAVPSDSCHSLILPPVYAV